MRPPSPRRIVVRAVDGQEQTIMFGGKPIDATLTVTGR
jgi:hypothetical protein